MIPFNPKGIIKFYLRQDQIEFGELMDAYSEKSDTIRHYYKYVGPPRKL